MKIRKWLEKNKVFFEVFSFIFLGSASIFVAYLSWDTSEKQLKISKIEQEPIIHVSEEVENDTSLVINIYNQGRPAFQFGAMPISVMSVTNHRYIHNDDFARYYFNVEPYYIKIIGTGNTTGLMAKIPIDIRSWISVDEMRDSIFSLDDSRGFFLDYQHLLWMEYQDISGEKHEKYYMISSSTAAYEINKKRYDSIFWKFYNNREAIKLSNFEKMGPEDLFDKVPIEESEPYDDYHARTHK